MNFKNFVELRQKASSFGFSDVLKTIIAIRIQEVPTSWSDERVERGLCAWANQLYHPYSFLQASLFEDRTSYFLLYHLLKEIEAKELKKKEKILKTEVSKNE